MRVVNFHLNYATVIIVINYFFMNTDRSFEIKMKYALKKIFKIMQFFFL